MGGADATGRGRSARGVYSLIREESTGTAIATSAAPHSDSPELPTCPACDLETPDTYAQAHAGPHSKIWREAEDKELGGLRAVGTSEELEGTW